MKKFTAIISFIFVFIGSIISQDDSKSFILSLKFAPSIDFLQPNTKDYKSDGALLKYTYGLIGDINIGGSGHYFLNIGLQFKNTGGKLRYDDRVIIGTNTIAEDVETSRRYKLNYVSIPLAFKLKTSQFGRMTYFGLFGIDNSIRVKAIADDEYKLQNSNTVNVKNININKKVSLFKESIIIGAGAEYTISGNTKAYAGLVFYNGFTDVLTGLNGKNTETKENALNKSIELMIGISF